MTYATGFNTPGYMPDNECNGNIKTLKEAKRCLVSTIENYIDGMDSDDTDRVNEAGRVLSEFKAAKPMECNVYIGDYVFWITKE